MTASFQPLEEMPGARFRLGRTVATCGALAALTHEDMIRALSRHVRGDWGDDDDISGRDCVLNEAALRDGHRLLSVYRSAAGREFWVLTEYDRSVTTVLLPNEY